MTRCFNYLRLNILGKFKTNKGRLHSLIPGVLLTTGFAASCITLNNTFVAEYSHLNTIDEHFHLMETLRKLAPGIDAKRTFHEFLHQLKSKESNGLFSADFVKKLLIESGITDEELIQHLIDIVDWNRDGHLSKYEIAALFTLFNDGNDVERYKFLFNCLDLNQAGTVDKDEFRHIFRCLLEAKYHIYGLENARDPDEIYTNIGINEYHTMAKFASNQLVRKIFIFADQKKRGKLNWTEFLYWCKRGGSQVLSLTELLYQTHGESRASEVIYGYKVGYIPEL